MYRDNDRLHDFSRRAFLIAGGSGVVFTALAARMYYLQVVEAERYATLADENRISIRLLPPPRGRIIDRFGRPMAVNRQTYRALIVPEDTPSVAQSLDALDTILNITEHERERVFDDVRRKRRFVPVVVRDNLSWEEVARIEVNAPDLAGVMIDVGESRHYLEGPEVAPVLGYVGAVSESELTGDPLLELPGFRVGKAGIEKIRDLVLRGRSGTSQVEVNALGRAIKELDRVDGIPGSDVRLTIDFEIQKMAADRLGDQSGSAVALDVHTGEVLAMVSTPSFDPNAFNLGISAEQWKALISNPKGPLNNKAVGGQYAPGSTYKLVTALAALERGVITPSATVFCPGFMRLGNARFHCWKRYGHGHMNMEQAITQSCDVYFYEVAKRTGVDRITAMGRKLGFGGLLDIDLPGERPGLTPTRDWKRRVKHVAWQQGETVINGIGQGYLLATPLQLAVMAARLANGARAVLPRLTQEVIHADGAVEEFGNDDFEKLGINPQHLAIVTKAMAAVVNSARGTARRARIKEEGHEMAGKTGTAQVRRISRAERIQGVKKNKDLEWKQRDHALFVAFAPVGAPRYAVSVVVEHGGGGSAVAAPIARDILIELQRRDPSGRQPGKGLAASSDPNTQG